MEKGGAMGKGGECRGIGQKKKGMREEKERGR